MTTEPTPRVEYRGTGFYASVIAAIATTAGLLALAGQNTADVTVEWLWFEMTAPLFVWIIGAALVAVAIDELVGVVWRARERARLAAVAAAEKPADAESEARAEATSTDLAEVAHDDDPSRR